MSEQKGLGSRLLGIFVESDGNKTEEAEALPTESGDKSAADLVAELAAAGAAVPGTRRGAPAASAPMPEPELASPLPALSADKLPAAMPGAPTDFDAIFRELGMDSAELDRVRKAEDLLKSLPEATPQAVKKQIVEASLKAFGFELDKIVLAAQNQRRALDAYVKVNETATAKAVQDAEAQVRALNEKIAALRGDIEKRTQGLTQLTTSVQARKKEVQKVIEFFQGPPPGTPGAP
ncbi:hypothetical protein [Hyalangium rubrum]|uniref:Uncharacterized protein n=1 Tax=Hyalangium rubrum TaxID=3103134 RepID=A0ABU5H140_9BACT|nr:hypothetical protein [Hyalangium sp. s54d21]MDY7227115.1 hypothetical protein [Hyalangium sp. s54d21]